MEYQLFSHFLIRSPFFPYNSLNSILSDKNSFLQKWSDQDVKNAIYIASPILYNELDKLFNENLKENDKTNRLLLSFVRYISRMTTRCTPFGLFAGCSIGKSGEITHIEFDGSISRTTRLDMYYLCTLFDSLVNIPEIKNKINYYPNTSLYQIGKKYRYIEYTYIQSKRKYHTTEIERSYYLDAILAIANTGTTRKKMIELLTNEDIIIDAASNFVDDLIESQILISELNQMVIGDDFFDKLVDLIERIEYSDTSLLPSLKRIQSLLRQLDISNENLEIYHQIIKLVEKIKVPYDEKFLFQVDLVKNCTQASIGPEIINELKSTMTFLNRISQISSNESLRRFQEEFYARYEEREVPLMQALDPQLGIGYPVKTDKGDISPLINNFHLPTLQKNTGITINSFQILLLKKAIDCISSHEKEIVFTNEDIKNFINPGWDDLPPTLYTLFEIIKANPENVLLKLNYFGGCSGANLLARFAHTDKNIAQLVNNITQKEEELIPDSILAEIAHLPESRVGNILSRPHIRKHELLFMSYSNLPEDQLIYISDLMLSVRNGKLVIRSKKLNKTIIPRLTNAHNYNNGTLAVYRFLCDMQHPVGRKNLFFNWGSGLENLFPFRPRVRYKQTILSPATWTVKKEEIEPFFSIKETSELIRQVTTWRKRRSIPELTLMPDGDNKLFIDWNSHLSILSLFSIIKERESIILTEFIFEEKEAIAKRGKDVYLNEFIVAFHKE